MAEEDVIKLVGLAREGDEMKKEKVPIYHKCLERTWKDDKNSYMKFGFVENAKPAHDVIYYEFLFKKEAKSPESSSYQQTLIQEGELTIEEAMTIVSGLSEAIRDYSWWKEEKTKRRFF